MISIKHARQASAEANAPFKALMAKWEKRSKFFSKSMNLIGKIIYKLDPLERLLVCAECGLPPWFHRKHELKALALDQHVSNTRFEPSINFHTKRSDIFDSSRL